MEQIEDPDAGMMRYFRFARGKPGKHPHEFNVLVYHVVCKVTRPKVYWNRYEAGKYPTPVRKGGRYRLETDWRLVIFLLLEVHLHSVRIPELAEFIRLHAKQPAEPAMRALKSDLLSRYKNFPPRQASPIPRRPDRTGFRKLIVTDSGRFRIVML